MDACGPLWTISGGGGSRRARSNWLRYIEVPQPIGLWPPPRTATSIPCVHANPTARLHYRPGHIVQ